MPWQLLEVSCVGVSVLFVHIVQTPTNVPFPPVWLNAAVLSFGKK